MPDTNSFFDAHGNQQAGPDASATRSAGPFADPLEPLGADVLGMVQSGATAGVNGLGGQAMNDAAFDFVNNINYSPKSAATYDPSIMGSIRNEDFNPQTPLVVGNHVGRYSGTAPIFRSGFAEGMPYAGMLKLRAALRATQKPVKKEPFKLERAEGFEKYMGEVDQHYLEHVKDIMAEGISMGTDLKTTAEDPMSPLYLRWHKTDWAYQNLAGMTAEVLESAQKLIDEQNEFGWAAKRGRNTSELFINKVNEVYINGFEMSIGDPATGETRTLDQLKSDMTINGNVTEAINRYWSGVKLKHHEEYNVDGSYQKFKRDASGRVMYDPESGLPLSETKVIDKSKFPTLEGWIQARMTEEVSKEDVKRHASHFAKRHSNFVKSADDPTDSAPFGMNEIEDMFEDMIGTTVKNRDILLEQRSQSTTVIKPRQTSTQPHWSIKSLRELTAGKDVSVNTESFIRPGKAGFTAWIDNKPVFVPWGNNVDAWSMLAKAGLKNPTTFGPGHSESNINYLYEDKPIYQSNMSEISNPKKSEYENDQTKVAITREDGMGGTTTERLLLTDVLKDEALAKRVDIHDKINIATEYGGAAEISREFTVTKAVGNKNRFSIEGKQGLNTDVPSAFSGILVPNDYVDAVVQSGSIWSQRPAIIPVHGNWVAVPGEYVLNDQGIYEMMVRGDSGNLENLSAVKIAGTAIKLDPENLERFLAPTYNGMVKGINAFDTQLNTGPKQVTQTSPPLTKDVGLNFKPTGEVDEDNSTPAGMREYNRIVDEARRKGSPDPEEAARLWFQGKVK